MATKEKMTNEMISIVSEIIRLEAKVYSYEELRKALLETKITLAEVKDVCCVEGEQDG